jgi:hypothetical protein
VSDYHSHPAISRSDLVLFAKSRRRFEHKKIKGLDVDPEDTEALRVGTGTHAIALKDMLTLETIKNIPKSVLNADGHKKGKAWTDFAESIEGDGNTWLKQDEWDECQRLSDAINDEELGLGSMIHGPRAEREKEIYWIHQTENGVIECRCKLDVLVSVPGGYLDPPWDIDHKLILDLKTTQSIDEWLWKREVEKRMLWVQDAHYTAGAATTTVLPIRFAFVLVEKGDPPRVRMRELHPDDRIVAMNRTKEILSQMQMCSIMEDYSESGEGLIEAIPTLRWY